MARRLDRLSSAMSFRFKILLESAGAARDEAAASYGEAVFREASAGAAARAAVARSEAAACAATPFDPNKKAGGGAVSSAAGLAGAHTVVRRREALSSISVYASRSKASKKARTELAAQTMRLKTLEKLERRYLLEKRKTIDQAQEELMDDCESSKRSG